MSKDNAFVRVKLIATDDSDKQQRIKASGRDGELFGGQKFIIRLQNAGVTSRPSGGTGLIVNLGHNSDQSLCVALENQDVRPADLEEGETKIYDEGGQSLYFKNNEVVLTCEKLTINVTGEIVIDGSLIKLGSGATKFVKLADGSNATKVKAE